MSARLRAMIVDDEELARRYLREMLSAHEEIEIVAECANGFEAVKAAGASTDLLFLDIQMPKLDGFEALELMEPPRCVIFVTAYDEYALKAFDVHAVDYLLKPFSAERFEEALARARERMGQTPPVLQLAAAARGPGRFMERIVVKDGASVHVVAVEDLDWVEAQDDYVALHAKGKSVLKQQTISALEAALDPALFVRIHRSWIVNLERVEKIEPYGKDSKVALLKGGKRVPVSRSGYGRIEKLLGSR